MPFCNTEPDSPDPRMFHPISRNIVFLEPYIRLVILATSYLESILWSDWDRVRRKIGGCLHNYGTLWERHCNCRKLGEPRYYFYRIRFVRIMYSSFYDRSIHSPNDTIYFPRQVSRSWMVAGDESTDILSWSYPMYSSMHVLWPGYCFLSTNPGYSRDSQCYRFRNIRRYRAMYLRVASCEATSETNWSVPPIPGCDIHLPLKIEEHLHWHCYIWPPFFSLTWQWTCI